MVIFIREMQLDCVLTNTFSCKILRDATPRSLVILDGESSQIIEM